MYRIISSIISTLIVVTSLWSQETVVGNVSDMHGNVIEGVMVMVDGTDIVDTTDHLGNYFIELPEGKHYIFFRKVGFETKKVSISQRVNNIVLEPTGISLLEMSLEELLKVRIITSAKKEEAIKDVPASVVVIKRSEIEAQGYQSLREIIESVPGVYITDERTQEDVAINMRGFWTRHTTHVAILVNGVSQRNEKSKHFSLNQVNVPVSHIERVEVVRGPMSVMYGSGAFFGVINIITNNDSNGAYNHAAITYGSNKMRQLEAFSKVKKENIEISTGFYLNERDGDDLKYSDLMSDPSKQGKDINASTGTLPFSRKNKSFMLAANYDGIYMDIKHVQADIGFTIRRAPIETFHKTISINDTRIIAGYKNEISSKLSFDFKFGFYNNMNYLIYSDRDSTRFQIKIDDLKSYDASLDLVIDATDDMEIQLGALHHVNYKNNMDIDFVLPGLQPNYLNNVSLLHPDDQITTTAAYTQLNYTPVEKLRLVMGLRGEQISEYKIRYVPGRGLSNYQYYDTIVPKSKLHLLPRLAVMYSFNPNHHLKFLYGQAMNTPSVLDNGDMLSFNSQNGYSKDYPTTEEIQTYELNYLSSFNNKHYLNVGFFYNSLKNLITRTGGFDEFNNSFVTYTSNQGEYITKGVELSYQLRNIGAWDFDVTCTYHKTGDMKNPDIEPAFSPDLLGYLKTSYRFKPIGNKNRNNIILGLNANYVDRMLAFWEPAPHPESTTKNPDDEHFIPKGRLGEETDAYTVLNTNVRIESFILNGLLLNLHIYNLLGTQIHYPTYNDNKWADKGMIGPGREINITLGYRF